MKIEIEVPDNATVEDVFRAVFPNQIENIRFPKPDHPKANDCHVLIFEMKDSNYTFVLGRDWWEKPYKI